MSRHGAKGSVAAVAVLVLTWTAAAHAAVDTRMNPTDAAGTVQNEVSITLNLNPGGLVSGSNVNLVSVYNDDPGANAGVGVSYSFDSGVSWAETSIGTGLVLNATPLNNAFDPISSADTLGTIYAGYIATTTSGGDTSGLYVHNSTDGGATWGPAVAVHTNPAAIGMSALTDPTFRFNDKPHLAVDNYSLNGNARNNLYTAWIQDVGGTPDKSDIRFAYSSDGGATWTVNPTPLNTNAGLDRANGPNVTVAPNGEVYVAWIDVDVTQSLPQTGTLMFNVSLNGGVTFNPAATQINAPFTSLPSHLGTQGNAGDDVRARGFPVIAADPTDNVGPPTLFLTYAALGNHPSGLDESDIYFIRSTDGGASWSSALRVNDDTGITDQFAPWMGVKPDGTIDIAWYDKRSAASDDMWDVYIARSTDGGLSFSINTLITDNPLIAPTNSTGSEDWLGEYLGLVVDANTAYLGFATSRDDGKGDVFFDAIANASIGAAVPTPGSLALLIPLAFASIGHRRR